MVLTHNSIDTLAGLVLGGLHRQAHRLCNVSADETPDGVILPVRRFADLGSGCSLFPAQEFEVSLANSKLR